MRERAVLCFCVMSCSPLAAHFAKILAAEQVLTQFKCAAETVFMRLFDPLATCNR